MTCDTFSIAPHSRNGRRRVIRRQAPGKRMTQKITKAQAAALERATERPGGYIWPVVTHCGRVHDRTGDQMIERLHLKGLLDGFERGAPKINDTGRAALRAHQKGGR